MTTKLRIVPLGGLGEIGKNMTVVEYDDQMIIIDAGIMFPENDMLGIDLIIPDYNYILERKENVEAILITHGHEDHVGALGHLMRDIDAPIFGTRLTTGLIRSKLKQAGLVGAVNLRTIRAGDVFQVGPFTIEPFHVAHSIPDGVGYGITTPVGLIVHSGDYKFDHTPVDGWPPDFAKLADFSQRGVLCLLADSTNAERAGWTPSEAVITEGLDDLFREAKGRIIVATFASLISRIQQVTNVAARYGRKLAITGRSMTENSRIARDLGYLKIPDGMIIDINQVNKMPPEQVAILATGSQGEPGAAIGRLAQGRHARLSIQDGDTVVLSAHPIPGNEEMIYRIINRLLQRGAEVLHEDNANVHVSGHASREEMKLLINLIKPKFFIPVHGELRHLKAHGKLAQEMGVSGENVAIVENGTILELDQHTLTVGPRIPGGYIFVDGSGVGDVGPAVMRDRERLADSGFFVAVASIDDDGNLRDKPELISRGFVFLDESGDLLIGAQKTIREVVLAKDSNREHLSKQIENALKKVFLRGDRSQANGSRGRKMTIESVSELQEALRRQTYIADRGLAMAIYLALKLKRPLFLEGEAGVGKTEVAKVIAGIRGTELIRLQCYEGLDIHHAVYEWNYTRQMLHIRLMESQGERTNESELFGPEYLLQRPLLKAIETTDGKPPVLLIDEIDRSDEEFEAYLLEILSDFQITIPEIGTIKAGEPPVVILTSNRTREVHDALKRRCLYYWIDYPTFDKELEIVKAKVPEAPESLAGQVTSFIQELRLVDLYKLPGVAETLEWTAALVALDQEVLEPSVVDDTLGVILKYQDDIASIKGNGSREILAAMTSSESPNQDGQ